MLLLSNLLESCYPRSLYTFLQNALIYILLVLIFFDLYMAFVTFFCFWFLFFSDKSKDFIEWGARAKRAFFTLIQSSFFIFSPPSTWKGLIFLVSFFQSCLLFCFLSTSPHCCFLLHGIALKLSYFSLTSPQYLSSKHSWSNSQIVPTVSIRICSFIFCQLAGLGKCSLSSEFIWILSEIYIPKVNSGLW